MNIIRPVFPWEQETDPDDYELAPDGREWVETGAAPFAQIPLPLLHSDLSLTAKVLYAELWSYTVRGRRYASPTRKRLAGALNVSLSTMDRAARELVDAGYVVITQQVNTDGSRRSSRYDLPAVPVGGIVTGAATPRQNDPEPPEGVVTGDEGSSHLGYNREKNQQDKNKNLTAAPIEPIDVDLSIPAGKSTTIPKDFALTQAMIDWAAENTPSVDVRTATRDFIEYWRVGDGARKQHKNWPLTWKNNMRRIHTWNLERVPKSGGPDGKPIVDEWWLR